MTKITGGHWKNFTHMKFDKPFIVSEIFRSHRFFANGVISARLDAEHKKSRILVHCSAVSSKTRDAILLCEYDVQSEILPSHQKQHIHGVVHNSPI